ncbi:serine/threonine protein kinase [Sanguibacter gelidistatuariae]|uniref:non-specific serine/threonine protein kinase n=2 Tax=Sanguibacter gelidistatuariae TaxID=1814289 RepID=A0A1G6H2V5_9MICO|nr:serine/threonine protein kinase [Sanguibacter gelidistatuariae]
MALGGRYRLVRLIAVGGMGEVWVAHDESLARDVAVKVLKEEFAGNADFLDRLRTEARNSAALSHSNIAQLYDYGEQQGSGYLVMELVQGEPMSDLLEREPVLPVLRLLSILSQTARALHAAHVAGVVHRDVKPGNILLERSGDVKITDFGVSLAANQVPMTAAGMVMGTAQYLSPEQAIGKAATGASDIYALGIVAYESILGNRPFTGATPVDIAVAHVNESVPPLPATIHAGFADLIMRMLEKDPLDRPRSGAILARNFDLLAQEIAADPWGSGLRRRSDDPRAGRHGSRAPLTGNDVDALTGPAPRRARPAPSDAASNVPDGAARRDGVRQADEPSTTTRASARIAAERGSTAGQISTPGQGSLAEGEGQTRAGHRAVGQAGWPVDMPGMTGPGLRDEASIATPASPLRAIPPRGSAGQARTRSSVHGAGRPAPARSGTQRPRQGSPARSPDGARPTERPAVRSTSRSPAQARPVPKRTSTTTGLRIGKLGWPTLALILLVLIVIIATIVKAIGDDSPPDSARAATAQTGSLSVQFTSVADLDAMIVQVPESNPSIPAPPTTLKDT